LESTVHLLFLYKCTFIDT